jgi:hypothetical protein
MLAGAPPVPAAAEGVQSNKPNSLSAAIYRYRADFNSYLAECIDAKSCNAGSEALARNKSSMKVLDTWDRPAESQSDAATALRLALEDYESGCTDRIPAMIKAAVGFLERSDPGYGEPVAVVSPRLIRVQDKLFLVRSLNEAVLMADEDIDEPDQRDAIGAVARIIGEKLLEVRDDIDEIRGEGASDLEPSR